MAQTKTKQPTAAAEVPQPEPRKPTPMELRHKEAQRQLDVLQEFIGEFADMSLVKFDTLKTFKLILDRAHGCTTPIEEFIINLVWRYEWAEADGRGLTLNDITSEVNDLSRADLDEEVRRAHLTASRYPLPKPADTASE